MAQASEQLTALMEDKHRYDIAPAELLSVQLEAANERLADRIGRIRLLANRAETGGVHEIRKREDIIPLLFAHTTYKTYTESWLTEGRWDRMSKWLETVSTHPVKGLDLQGIQGVDDWLGRLESVNHYVTCSSGTTGKPAMMSCSKADLDISARHNVAAFEWATGIERTRDRKFFGLQPKTAIARNEAIGDGMRDAFGAPGAAFDFPAPQITLGQVIEMIALRRKVADGTARPGEITAYESLSASRQATIDGAVTGIAEEMIASRHQKLSTAGMWPTMYKVAEAVRAKGYDAKDFHPENSMTVAGGLKGAILPPNYKDYILGTFNVQPQRMYHLYSMQEINTPFPMCSAGRYHIAPWVMLLPLDASGEHLLDASDGEIECRAAFFDVSLDARWGGVISGDRIRADFGKCPCGHQGPTVAPEITRYADLAGGDKISCAGTIDAYVRGVT